MKKIIGIILPVLMLNFCGCAHMDALKGYLVVLYVISIVSDDPWRTLEKDFKRENKELFGDDFSEETYELQKKRYYKLLYSIKYSKYDAEKKYIPNLFGRIGTIKEMNIKNIQETGMILENIDEIGSKLDPRHRDTILSDYGTDQFQYYADQEEKVFCIGYRGFNKKFSRKKRILKCNEKIKEGAVNIYGDDIYAKFSLKNIKPNPKFYKIANSKDKHPKTVAGMFFGSLGSLVKKLDLDDAGIFETTIEDYK